MASNIYRATNKGIIRVVDPDMNLNPEKIDIFIIHVWSDTDPKGIDIQVYETNEASGIFEAEILFITTENSSGNKLRVSEGDTVTAEYKDKTLPSPYNTTDELEISATATIKT